MKKLPISVSHILSVIDKLPKPQHLWLAYSGGIDSAVLLHILAQNQDRPGSELIAVHVNHKLSPYADAWAEHCKSVCAESGIRLETITIHAKKTRGASQEAHAREMRYNAIMNLMDKSDLLMTAHHMNDQAETMLLQLLRGAGPEGLAGMPVIRAFGQGWLVRPLLDYSREQLQDYALNHNLKWIDDESNKDINIDRNYIRHRVIPFLEQRWPSAVATLSRSARHQSDVINILFEIAEQDLEGIRGNTIDVLNLAPLKKLSSARARNLLRYWLRINGHQVANTVVMENIINELIFAENDSMPCVRWHETEIRRYRDTIHVMKSMENTPVEDTLSWCLEQPLEFYYGRLEASLVKGKGISPDFLENNTIKVQFRNGGETIRPAGRKETHKLKKLFQEAGVPPWQRDRIPLLYIKDKLAAVAGYWVDDMFKAGKDEAGWDISLTEYSG